MQDPIETVYVKLEVDTSDYIKQVDTAITDTVKRVQNTKAPTMPSVVPSQSEQQNVTGWFNKLKSGFSNVKGMMTTTAAEGGKIKGILGTATNGMKSFVTTGKGLSTVTSSVSSLGSAFSGLAASSGPIAVVIAGIAAIGIGISNTVTKAKEAIVPLTSMLSVDTLSKNSWDINRESQKAGGVDTAKKFEDYNTQFEVLLGGIDKAEARISEYAVFGAKTPYNLPEIVQAGKLLQTMGGEALATGEALTMTGDMAAATGRPFTELAMWVGRTYSAMQSGRPFGEAAMRLQELGVLSGESRNELEKLQKSGASSTEQWAKFTEIMSKYEGMMDKMSRTLSGLQGNYEDFQEQVALAGGTPIFEAEKKYLEGLILDVKDEKKGVFAEHEKDIKGMAESIGAVKGSFLEFANTWKLTFLENLPYEQTAKLLESIEQLVKGFNKAREEAGAFNLPESLGKGITVIVDKLQKGVEWVKGLWKYAKSAGIAFSAIKSALKPVYDLFTQIGVIISKVNIAILKLVAGVGGFAVLFGPLGIALSNTKKAFDDVFKGDWIRSLAETIIILSGFIKTVTGGFEPLIELLKEVSEGFTSMLSGDWDAVGEHAKAAWAMAKDGVVDFQTSGREAMAETEAKLKELDEAWAEKKIVVQIEVEVKELKAAEIEIDQAAMDEATKFADQLQDLQAENAKAVEEMKERSLKNIASMEESAFKQSVEMGKQLAESKAKLLEDAEKSKQKILEKAARTEKQRQEDYDKQERREKEDHYKEMNRIQDDYLYNLADAVKNRDASAIRDLRRRKAHQVEETESSYQENKQRKEEDFVGQEQRNKESLELQLQDLEENTRLRTEALNTQFNEEQDKLWENLQAQKDAEAESQAERLEQMNDAQKEKLASMAESMAKEGKLTEEQVRKIVELENETFGIGGDIDKIMDDFVSRKTEKDRISAVIEVSYKYSANAASVSQNAELAGQQMQAGIPYSALQQMLNAQSSGIGYSRPVSPQGMATGGLMIARKPTLVQIAEGGEPEVFSAAPLSTLGSLRSSDSENVNGKFQIEISGSAPPGIGVTEVDAIAGVIVKALGEAKVTKRKQNY